MTVDKIPFRKKLALELFQLYKKNTTKIHDLRFLFWECTLRCNLNCRHCGSECTKVSGVEDMPIGDFLRVLDEEISTFCNPNKTMIGITGGEPLVRDDLEEAGIEIIKRGYPWGIVSNGLALTEKRFESLLRAGLHSITISFDGLEDSHNWLRKNSNSWKNAFEAIKRLPKVPELEYDVATCVTPKNYHELEEIRQLLIDNRIKAWRLFSIFPVGRASLDSELFLNSEQFKGMMDFIADSRRRGGIKTNYGCEGFVGSYEADIRDNFFFCRAGINVGSVLVDGGISACPDLRDNFIQGNIYKDSFRDVWENKYEIMRKRNWTKTGVCKDCKMFKYCEGNGMHLRKEDTGELLFCHYKKLLE
jgi:radical SAM enzyme (rSAM/lipoprotein system)